MRILQLIQKPQLRGAEIFACQLSEELVEKGHEVDVLYLFDHNQFDLEFNLNYKSLGADRRKRFWDFGAYKRLSKIIKNGKYDIVQANAGDTLKYAAISKKLYNWATPLIFRNANKMSDFIKSKPHYILNKFFLDQTDYIISVSENCRRDIISLYPRAKNISSTGTIGTYDFSNVPESNIHRKSPVWINVGSFVPEKNHQFLINLFSAYYKQNNNGELWLVGDGKLRKKLEELVEELGIKEQVKFFGYRKDVINLIKAADLMVMPSKIEGLPGVILEALSCGKPVVASDVGGIPEVVINDETGYTISGFDKDEYLTMVGKALADDNYKKLSESGQRMIEEKFLMKKIASEFEAIYLFSMSGN